MSDKNIERRIAAEQAYKEQAGSLRLAKVSALKAHRDAAQSLAQLQGLQTREESPTSRRCSGDNMGEEDADSQQSEQSAAEEEGEASAGDASEVEEDDEEEPPDREMLAGLVQELVKELALSRGNVERLQQKLDEALTLAPPPFVDLASMQSDRSRRRTIQNDVEFLEEIFSQRQWRPCDIARALESTGLLQDVCESRQVCPPAPYIKSGDAIVHPSLTCPHHVHAGLGNPHKVAARRDGEATPRRQGAEGDRALVSGETGWGNGRQLHVIQRSPQSTTGA